MITKLVFIGTSIAGVTMDISCDNNDGLVLSIIAIHSRGEVVKLTPYSNLISTVTLLNYHIVLLVQR